MELALASDGDDSAATATGALRGRPSVWGALVHLRRSKQRAAFNCQLSASYIYKATTWRGLDIGSPRKHCSGRQDQQSVRSSYTRTNRFSIQPSC